MCCFSKPVKLVANTNIFARGSEKGRQFIVYSMMLTADEDLAMILPIPVAKKTKEDDVKFINLEKYQDFFGNLRSGFREPPTRGLGAAGGIGSKKDSQPLKVVEVGSYEASFVPTVKDFGRLDERFRLPAGVWDKLGQYKDYGFAVFKLKKGSSKVHPMAFEFPRAKTEQLFFPTVHIHDGEVHDKAGFDHFLYCQVGEGETVPIFQWRESDQPAKLFMKMDKAKGLLDGDAHCYLRQMNGKLKNEDVWV